MKKVLKFNLLSSLATFSNQKNRNVSSDFRSDKAIFWYNYRSLGLKKKIEYSPDNEKIKLQRKLK